MTLSRENFKYIIIGCLVVILGFALMSGGGTEDPNTFNEDELFSFRRITLAPFLVMAGYGIVLFGILKRPKQNKSNQPAESSSENKEDLEAPIDK